MQISRGVEWAAHAASLLATLPEGMGLRAEALAQYHGVPQAYMAKQMQALSKAGLVHTSRGRQGGYRLAKPAEEITLWDIMAAIEGKSPAFTCTTAPACYGDTLCVATRVPAPVSDSAVARGQLDDPTGTTVTGAVGSAISSDETEPSTTTSSP